MKTIAKFGLGLATATVVFFSGCNNSTDVSNAEMKSKSMVSEESLGLRKTDLYSETLVTPDKTEYSKSSIGSGNTINRAFQDAPPMIPHDVEGMLPITIADNQCKMCHVDSAPYDATIPSVPKSHLTDFRPMTSLAKDGKIVKNGKRIENTSSEKLEYVTIKEKQGLIGARYNCSQCHAPQSEGGLVVDNTFTPEYTTPDGDKKSHWTGSKLTEGLDTLAQ